MPYAANEADSTQYAATGTTLNVLRTNPDVIPIVWTEVPFATLDTVPDWRKLVKLQSDTIHLSYNYPGSAVSAAFELMAKDVKFINPSEHHINIEFVKNLQIVVCYKKTFDAVEYILSALQANNKLQFNFIENLPEQYTFSDYIFLAENILEGNGISSNDVNNLITAWRSYRSNMNSQGLPMQIMLMKTTLVNADGYLGSLTTELPEKSNFNETKHSLWFEKSKNEYLVKNK
jgi:hypothetical protein